MTPTEQAAVERYKGFRQRIAEKAAELELKRTPPPAAPDPDPPAPWFSWIKRAEQAPCGSWFSIIDDLGPRSEPSIALIQKVCCRYFAISQRDLNSSRRTADLVNARQIGMFLAKEMTSRSLPEIGRRFGNRDHTTVLYAVRKIGLLSKSDPSLLCDLDSLRSEIGKYAP